MSTVVRLEPPASEGTCRRFRPIALQDQEKERRRLVVELTERFPDRGAAEVERAADVAWRSLDDARVRDFVPVLAMKAAVALLASTASTAFPEAS